MTGETRLAVSDHELVDELRDYGSEPAFRELHRRHTPRMLQLILRMRGGAESDTEDLVQETWIRAVKSLPSFRGDSQFGTWLVGICVHVTQDCLRKAKHPHVSLDEVPEPLSPEPPHAERIDLEKVLALLPTGCRTVLLLHDLEGFSHAEIAEMLGIAEGTSKSQLSAARRLAQSLFDRTPKSESLRLARGRGA
ncbi:MAG: sigma-70 family RNA polymerase sigma factor [Gemmatimonadales bacterium]|nr:sigma-70 family RNA polymerase sigma factor [Gemmatimonadales bacterium]